MPKDIRTSELDSPIDLAEYLFRRLHEVGIRAVHGVPGDYNLAALDYLAKCGLDWVGNCNELNAGYAADGYARVKGISALITTFGVGELSAINAVAGAYSEYVPIVHIVGTPSTESMKDGMLLHHTLGNGDFNVFANMGASIACSVAKLVDAHDAATLIDNALRECWVKSRPVYITLPTDMIAAKVEGQRLKTPIDLSFPENEAEKEDYVVETVLKYLHAAKSPIILVDACAVRHRVLDEVHDLIRTSNLPYFVAPMGKGAVDESGPHYGGVYAGDASHKEVRERVESSDLVLSIGALKTDFNTAGFTYRVSQLSTIDFHSTYVRVKYSEYPGVGMKGVLRKIIKMMGELNVRPGPTINNEIAEGERDLRGAITHNWLWPRLGHWLQEDDIVITETGTANLGIWETRFPKGVTALNQVLWGSIGYSVGACQGAALAARETGSRRTVLWVGDGSLQVTAQEISTIIRHDLKPIIFVICNDGYTIERMIHGIDATYNDIQDWKYKDIVGVFGGDKVDARTFQVKTKKELDDLFEDDGFAAASSLQFVEVYMQKKDAPRPLKLIAEASAGKTRGSEGRPD